MIFLLLSTPSVTQCIYNLIFHLHLRKVHYNAWHSITLLDTQRIIKLVMLAGVCETSNESWGIVPIWHGESKKHLSTSLVKTYRLHLWKHYCGVVIMNFYRINQKLRKLNKTSIYISQMEIMILYTSGPPSPYNWMISYTSKRILWLASRSTLSGTHECTAAWLF